MATSNPFTSAQAPAYNILAPDLAAQQIKLSRQQQMADLLRQQALQQDQGTQVVNGWAVKKSPFEGLAKIAAALGSRYSQDQIDDKQAALSKALGGRLSDAFNAQLNGGTLGDSQQQAAPQSPQVDPSALGAAPQQSTPSAPGPQPMAPQQAAPQQAPQQPDPVQQLKNSATAAYLSGNTELANKLIQNLRELTTNQKDMMAMGQDPHLMGQLATAAARKNGIIEYQPGTTAQDLLTGAERFQPKVGEGIGYANGQASALPGYADANAGIAGASAGAVARAQAQTKLITVNLPGGPRQMTEAQAAQLAQGGQPPQAQAPTQGGMPPGAAPAGPPNQGFPAGAQVPPPMAGGGEGGRMDILQQEMTKLQALPDSDPSKASNIAMLQREMAGTRAPSGAAPTTAPTQSNMPGIALKTPAQEAQDAAAVKLATDPQLAQKTQEYKDMAEYGKTLDGHVSESQALLQRVAESREALGKFKAGGGAENRTKLASMAQAVGLPKEVVDKIGGGDLASAQVFQKFAAQEALGTMQQALASDSGKGAQGNRISMDLFIKNNPNITTDPNAIEKVFNFITKQAQQTKAQQDAYHTYKANPNNDPSNFPAYWSGEQIKRGYVNPQIVTGQAMGTVPAAVQSLLDKYPARK